MATDLQMTPQLEQIHGEIRDNFRALANGFQKLDKIKDPNRQSKQLEELTGRMRECKRLIKEFDREMKDEERGNPPEVNKQLNDEKQSMVKELNSYVALRKTFMSSLGNKRLELFDMGAGASDPTADDNVQVASSMSNQELIQAGNKTMDETDQTIERSKQVVAQTIEVGTGTAVTLKGQTDQMGRIVNELDTIQFSIKKASQLVKEIGRQVATDKCIMLFLFLIVCGVIAIIIVKVCILSRLSFMTLNFCNVLNSPALIELKGEMNPKPAPSGVAQR
ncbi:novel plant SNARE 13 isoform X1 [Vitis vinifera]|uniref:novel plant SNARE 13 isoform X1 n=1 Tax=Vitis vinifera TaxID=29760 RepID=UPI0028834C8B|nr:novel plant SNARE 13 isoform X1 [Vitis vinifera]XP_059592738.1 novel plant SNARE 13 isoform X1 [Vitis vinifera]